MFDLIFQFNMCLNKDLGIQNDDMKCIQNCLVILFGLWFIFDWVMWNLCRN